MNNNLAKYHVAAIYVVLIVGVIVAFEGVAGNEFLTYDDDYYVTGCDQIKEGLSWETIVWAFAEPHYYMWHPLTTLSYLFEYELFGLDSFWYHVTNLLIHIANSVLLFWVLKRMTGAVWASAFVAGVFAVHPLQVESVAWVAERKNLLSGFFWILTIATYVRYCRRPGVGRYALVVLIFCFALMSKPTVVTLPFVLLLLDYWPLRRLKLPPDITTQRAGWLICEKIPLILLSAGLSVVTFVVQKGGGAVKTGEHLTFAIRISNAFVSYVKYIGKIFCPRGLAVLYPHPGGGLPLWQPICAFVLVVGFSVLVLWMVRRRGYAAVGWFWYLGILVPVIGFIQSGVQAMADRYAYLPLIGISIIVAWGAREFADKWGRRGKAGLANVAGVVMIVLVCCTRMQVGHWQNNHALYGHALEVTENNYVMQNNFGTVLREKKQYEEAIVHFDKALSIKPDYVKALNNKGKALYDLERYEEAAAIFERVLKMTNVWADPYNNLGLAYDKLGEYELAVESYNEALLLEGNNASYIYNLALTLARQGKYGEALERYKEVLELKPEWPEAHYNLGAIYVRQQKLDLAVAACSEALRLKPDYVKARASFAYTLYSMGRVAEAIGHYDKLLELDGEHVEGLNDLAYILATADDSKLRDANRAIELAQKACELTEYKKPSLLDTLSTAYVAAGRVDEAIRIGERAVEAARALGDLEKVEQIENRLRRFKSRQGHGISERKTSDK